MSNPPSPHLDDQAKASLERDSLERHLSLEQALRDTSRRTALAADMPAAREDIEPFAKRSGITEEEILRDAS
jgi:hypothetical protein